MVRALADRTLRRNFQGYTTDRADMLFGAGVSSIGALPQGYAQNETQFIAYARAVEAGRLPVARGIALTGDDRFRRELIERVMCFLEVDLGEVAASHGVPRAELAPMLEALAVLERDGVVRLAGDRVAVNEECRALVRSVAAAFDAYLNPTTGRHSLAV
jgi:oxygen-independent coproporphyrinogen-3 oxidase